MNPPLITICIVVFNGESFIADAVASVLNQSYSQFELIILDGGSTDGTIDVLKPFADRISRFVSEPDGGIYDAMNKACAMARGDWLLFLGCDDILLDSLAPIANQLRDRDTVYYGDVILKASGRVYGGPFSKYRLLQKNICHQAIFYPRNVYQKYRYDLKYRFLADYALNMRLIGSGVHFQHVSIKVAIFNDAGSSMAGDRAFQRDKFRLIWNNFGPFWALLKVMRTLLVLPFRLLSSSFSRK